MGKIFNKKCGSAKKGDFFLFNKVGFRKGKVCQGHLTGFTLVELLVVIFIIGLLSAIILPNYNQGAEQLALDRSASTLYQNVRRVSEMALSSAVCQAPGCNPGEVPVNGYGLALSIYAPTPGDTLDNTKYIIYAHQDTDSENYYYNPATDVVLETIPLEKGVIVSSIIDPTVNPPDYLDHLGVNFRSPGPTIGMMCDVCGYTFNTQAEIILALKDNPSKTKVIYVNIEGLIYEK